MIGFAAADGRQQARVSSPYRNNPRTDHIPHRHFTSQILLRHLAEVRRAGLHLLRVTPHGDTKG